MRGVFGYAFGVLSSGFGVRNFRRALNTVCRHAQVLLIQVMVITREFLVMSRHNLVPGWFAYVNPHTGTPLRIVIPFGIAKGARPHAPCWLVVSVAGALPTPLQQTHWDILGLNDKVAWCAP